MKPCIAALAFVALFVFAGSVLAAERPNILLIVADDLGWGDVGYHGGPAGTPNMDRLVATGVELDRFYVHPVCSPTRAALLTGRYPSRFGPHVCLPTNRRALPADTVTLSSALGSLGYDTSMAGKWHLGTQPQWGPLHYGFDRAYGSMAGAVDPWTHHYRKGPYMKSWHRDHKLIEEQGNATELVADQVLQWIRERPDPWFIYVPFHAVHTPIDAPQRYKDLYAGTHFDEKPARNESYQRYAAFISQLDDKIGQFVQALEATGQRDNTLILFFSDNGALERQARNPYDGQTPPTPRLGSNKPLRGWKNQLYEGGIRVPAFVNWPARLKPTKVTAPLHVSDWFPTLSRIVGYEPETNLQWDGRDAWPLLEGRQSQWDTPRTAYWTITPERGFALLHGNWKLIARPKDGTLSNFELFNLADDPFEKQNLAEQHPKQVQNLLERIEQHRKGDLHEVPEDLRDFPG